MWRAEDTLSSYLPVMNFSSDLEFLDKKDLKNFKFEITNMVEEKINASTTDKFNEGAFAYCKTTNEYVKIQKVIEEQDKEVVYAC